MTSSNPAPSGRPASGPPAPGTLRQLSGWLLRSLLVGGAFWLFGRLERGIDPGWLPGLGIAAAAVAGVALLATGAGFARDEDILANRRLEWLLLPPWAVLFWLVFRLLEGGIASGLPRALAAAALSTLATMLLAVAGVVLRDAAERRR